MNIAYLGNFRFNFTTESHIKATLEEMGHHVIALQEDEVEMQNVINISNNADIFLWTRTLGYLKFYANEMLKNILVTKVSYHLDLYVGIKREDNISNDPFWKTDFVFTPDGDPYSKYIFRKEKIKHYYMPPAVYKKECYIGKKVKELENDIIFVGNVDNYHEEWTYRKDLINFLRATYKDRFRVFPNKEYPCVRGQLLNNLYASSKIVIGDTLCKGFTHQYYWSDRLPETIGRGGFLIHPFIKGMEKSKLAPNCVTYKFGDFKELKNLIDHYLKYENKREIIRNYAHNECKNNHTYTNRMNEMLRIISCKNE